MYFLLKSSIRHYLNILRWHYHWALRHGLKHYGLRGALLIVVVVVATIAIQLLYPANRALPLAKIGNTYVSFKSHKALREIIAATSDATLDVQVIGSSYAVTPKEVGIVIDPEKTVAETQSYSLKQRLVPFSLLRAHQRPFRYTHTIDEKAAKEFGQRIAVDNNQPPKNAILLLEGANVKLVPSEDGHEYHEQAVLAQLRTTTLDAGLKLKVTPQVAGPAISTQVASDAADKIQTRLGVPLSVTALGKTLTFDGATLANWTIIKNDEAKKTVQVEYDRTKISNALKTLSGQVYIAADPNTVVVVDGAEVSRDSGSEGQVLSLEESIDGVVGAMDSQQSSIAAKVVKVTPETKYDRRYTRSSKGLQALIDYWARSHGGQYGITLEGAGVSANYNGGKTFTSASIYKMYLAYIVYQRVAAGTMSLDTITSTGKSVNDCIDVMIVRSDNICAEVLGGMVGWSANDGTLKSAGFGSTTLRNGGFLTTANDTVSLLTKLRSGSLVRSDLGDSLLSMMNRQIYRSGIPAGSRGSGVANKVGFIGSYNHDAAIVYHPKGTYALVVLTSGSNFSNIADLSRQIHAVMSQ